MSIRFSRSIVRCTLAALVAGVSMPRPAQAAESLPLSQALHLAQERSQQLAAHASAAAAARDMALAAAKRPDPVLRFGVDNLPIDGADRFSLTRDFMTMRSVGVMQELTRSEKLQARATRFEREAAVAGAERALAMATLQQDTAMAWLDRHFQEQIRDALVRQLEEALLQIEAADAAYRGGRGSQADVFAARSSRAQIEDRIAEAERRVATATTQLARWVGDPATAPLAPPEPMDAVPHADDLEPWLRQQHPQIVLLARQEDVARAEAEIARSERNPDWTVEATFSQRGPAYSNLVSFNVSVPLPWNRKDRQDRELSARLAIVRRLRAEREEATRVRVAEARTMLQEWRSGGERLRRYDATLVPLAAERTRAALAAYRGGAGPLGAVLDARRGEIDVLVERLRLASDTARAWAQLNYLIPQGHDPK